jgi:glycosyltransferase involved in cell wall biosynthesis
MKISVIIPAYNEEKNIASTLDAIFASDYPNFEVIVIDNASTDATHVIASKTGARVIREDRKGTMWACEAGRKIAHGDIIVRLDADCLPEKSWLARGATWFADKKISAVSGPYDYFDGPKTFRNLSLFFQKYFYAPLSYILSLGRKGGVLIGGNSFMRATALEKIGGFNTSIVFYGDDSDVAKRISSQGKIVFDNALILKTSARRFKAEGTLKIGTLYIFNFFKIMLSPVRNGKKKRIL